MQNSNKNNNLELKLAADTNRNRGIYKPERTLVQLEALIETCMDEMVSPGVFHVRVRPVGRRIEDGVTFLRNRLAGRKVRYGWVKATEADPGEGLHLHFFIIVDMAIPGIEHELREAFWAMYRNGYARSYLVIQPKQPAAPGTDWKTLETPYLPLTDETRGDALFWMSYALKNRSKERPLEEGRMPVLFRFPTPKPRGPGRAKQ